MVVMLMHCDGCAKGGAFDVEISVVIKRKSCSECHQDQSQKWNYYFCTMACFISWQTRLISLGGFPCRDCRGLIPGTRDMGPTGYQFGHEHNGSCSTCDGTKLVKWENAIMKKPPE